MVFLGYALIAIIVAALLFYAAVALLPSGLSLPVQRDEIPFRLPDDRRLDTTDLDRIRIPVALRGYRFAETEELIDRLIAELQARDGVISERDDEIAGLRRATASAPPEVPPTVDEGGS